MFGARERTADEPDDLLNRLHGAVRIAGGASETDEKADVTGDAISHFTESGEINEEPLFKERWERIVQVSEPGKPPKVLCDFRIFGSKPEEVGQHTEALSYFSLQILELCWRLRFGNGGFTVTALGHNGIVNAHLIEDAHKNTKYFTSDCIPRVPKCDRSGAAQYGVMTPYCNRKIRPTRRLRK